MKLFIKFLVAVATSSISAAVLNEGLVIEPSASKVARVSKSAITFSSAKSRISSIEATNSTAESSSISARSSARVSYCASPKKFAISGNTSTNPPLTPIAPKTS